METLEIKHSITLWIVAERSVEDNTIAIRCEAWVPRKTSPLAYVTPRPAYRDEQKVNAEFIVRACNVHENLLEACKEAQRLLWRIEAKYGVYKEDIPHFRNAKEIIADAIAKAEGSKP